MELEMNMSATAMESMTSWCGECNAQTPFDLVPGGTGIEYACRRCSAAMFAGDLLVIESILQPA